MSCLEFIEEWRRLEEMCGWIYLIGGSEERGEQVYDWVEIRLRIDVSLSGAINIALDA